jgi:hypothetical protein
LVAFVESVGVTGLTVKHSVELESDDPPRSLGLVAVNSARQQYRPASVSVMLLEVTFPFPVTVLLPASAPPLVQRSVELVAVGPQRWNATEPLKVDVPLTVSSAVSLTVTELGFVVDVGGRLTLPFFPALGVVTSVDPQLPKFPSAKSCSTEVPDCDDRVLRRTLEKQALAKPSPVRSRPPS